MDRKVVLQAHLKRIPGLDLLRAFAILLVFYWHYRAKSEVDWLSWISPYGWTGVDLFFVLSGFLIASQLFKPFVLGVVPSIKNFYLKRSFRILPAYLAVVALYFLVPAWNETQGLAPLWKFLTFTLNFRLDRLEHGGFSHAWSLCVEEHFYLAFPLLAILVYRTKHWIQPKIFVMAMLATILIGGMILRAMLWLEFISPVFATLDGRNLANLFDKVIYYPSYNRLDGLLVGVVIALLFTFRPTFKKWIENHPNLPAILGLVFLGLACWVTTDRFSFLATVLGFPAFSFGFGGLVMSAATPGSALNRLYVPGAALMATLAYTLYLTHKELIHLFHPLFKNFSFFENETSMILAIFAVSIVGAVTLHLLVERPFLQLRNKVLGKTARSDG